MALLTEVHFSQMWNGKYVHRRHRDMRRADPYFRIHAWFVRSVTWKAVIIWEFKPSQWDLFKVSKINSKSFAQVYSERFWKGLFTHLVQDKRDLCISCLYELQTWITFLCSLSPQSLYSLSVCQCLKMYLLNITKPVSTYICDCKPPEDLCTCLRELWLGRGGGGGFLCFMTNVNR